MLARFPRRSSFTLVGAVALVMAIANPAAAPPGDLDPTFDGDGKVTTDFAGNFDEARGVAIQADGKIVAAGIARVPTGDDFALARYNPDGSLDLTFDGDGKVTTAFAAGTGNDEASAVAIQGDGKIVAAGRALGDFALVRYNPDGSLDTTFDGDGKLTTDFGGGDAAEGVAIQPDGKIVAAGVVVIPGNPVDFALARYNTDGSLDPTFDGDGKVTTDFGDAHEFAYAVAIQGDGKIVAAGEWQFSGGFSHFALARYNPDGSLDSSFDGDGRLTTDVAGPPHLPFDEAHGVAIQTDGKIVAGGFAFVSDETSFDFALARYNPDGSLDTTFSGDGKVTTHFAGDDEARGIAIQPDGRILAAGFAFVSGNTDFALARYKVDGSLDTTFSGDGKVTTDFAGDTDQASAVAIQANGRIVAAGFTVVSGQSGQDFALARYTCFRRTSRSIFNPLCS